MRRLLDELAAAAVSAASKLTILEFGDGTIAHSLLVADHPNLEEVVVIGSGKSATTASSSNSTPTQPLPAGASAWGNSCKTPSQMLSLARALFKAKRTRVAIAFTAAAGATPTTQLRILQLFLALCEAQFEDVLLLLEAPLPPATTDRACQKAVFCASRRTTPRQLTFAMLPKEAAARRRAWCAFLAASLQDSGATVAEVDGVEEGKGCGSSTGTGECSSGERSSAGVASCVLLARHTQRRITQSSTIGSDGLADEMASSLFPPVVMSVVDQLESLKAEIDESVRKLPPAELRPRGSAFADSTSADASTNGIWQARLVASSAARYLEGGYSALHYVPAAPGPHATSYELELLPVPNLSGSPSSSSVTAASSSMAEDSERPRRIGYIALLAYGVDNPSTHFPCTVPWRTMHAVQVERLVVAPDWRGSGALEALLAACEPYVTRGYPVRVKTGSERAHSSFMRCPILAYEGHRAAGATACGVRRPMKRYARVLAAEAKAAMASDGIGGTGHADEADAHIERRDGDAHAPTALASASMPFGRRRKVEDALKVDDRDYEGGWRRGAEGTGESMHSDPARDTGAAAGPATHAAVHGSEGDCSATPVVGSSQTAHGPASPAVSSSAAPDPTLRWTPRLSGAAKNPERALINKLTADSFERILPPLAALAMRSTAALRTTLSLLFARAAREPLFCSLYASAAARLAASLPALAIDAPTFDASVEDELRVVLTSPALGGYPKSAGRLTAELLQRELIRMGDDDDALRANGLQDAHEDAVNDDKKPSPLGLLLAGSCARLCAFTAAAGYTLHRRKAGAVLSALIKAVGTAGLEDGHGGEIEGGAPRAACAHVLELHRRGWQGEDADQDATVSSAALKTVGEVRREAADDMGLVLAPCDATSEQLRGLREGWVHWYVGSPIVHPENGKLFRFDETTGRIALWRPQAAGESADKTADEASRLMALEEAAASGAVVLAFHKPKGLAVEQASAPTRGEGGRKRTLNVSSAA
jgi:hypothetical protein